MSFGARSTNTGFCHSERTNAWSCVDDSDGKMMVEEFGNKDRYETTDAVVMVSLTITRMKEEEGFHASVKAFHTSADIASPAALDASPPPPPAMAVALG